MFADEGDVEAVLPGAFAHLHDYFTEVEEEESEGEWMGK